MTSLDDTVVLPRMPEPPNVVPPVDERWRVYRQQLVGLPRAEERVDLPPPVFAPWIGRELDTTVKAKHLAKRGQ